MNVIKKSILTKEFFIIINIFSVFVIIILLISSSWMINFEYINQYERINHIQKVAFVFLTVVFNLINIYYATEVF